MFCDPLFRYVRFIATSANVSFTVLEPVRVLLCVNTYRSDMFNWFAMCTRWTRRRALIRYIWFYFGNEHCGFECRIWPQHWSGSQTDSFSLRLPFVFHSFMFRVWSTPFGLSASISASRTFIRWVTSLIHSVDETMHRNFHCHIVGCLSLESANCRHSISDNKVKKNAIIGSSWNILNFDGNNKSHNSQYRTGDYLFTSYRYYCHHHHCRRRFRRRRRLGRRHHRGWYRALNCIAMFCLLFAGRGDFIHGMPSAVWPKCHWKWTKRDNCLGDDHVRELMLSANGISRQWRRRLGWGKEWNEEFHFAHFSIRRSNAAISQRFG